MVMESARSNKNKFDINYYTRTDYYKPNFYYNALSSTCRESVSSFTDKTKKMANMRYVLEIQKDNIVINKEEENNRKEQFMDLFQDLKLNKMILEKDFMPSLDKHLKAIRKKADFEKNKMNKLKNEYEKQKNKITDIEMNIVAIHNKIQLGQEYMIFLTCLKNKNCISHAFYPSSPMKRIFKKSTIRKHTSILIDFDLEGLIGQFSKIENEILDLIDISNRKKEFIELNINRLFEPEDKFDVRDERLIQAEKNLNKYKIIHDDLINEKKRQEESIGNDYNFKCEIDNLFQLVKCIDINKKEEIDPLFKENRKILTQLHIIEKSVVYLKTKRLGYLDNPLIRSKAIEIEESLEKERRMRMLVKNQKDLIKIREMKIEKEHKRREYLETFSSIKTRKVKIPFKPSTYLERGVDFNVKTFMEEFNELIEY
jgi:hypothetical protein